MNEQLSPCPCCGGEAHYESTAVDWRIVCGTCGLRTEWHISQTKARDTWARRVPVSGAEMPPVGHGQVDVPAAGCVICREWDTPAEDAAWAHLAKQPVQDVPTLPDNKTLSAQVCDGYVKADDD